MSPTLKESPLYPKLKPWELEPYYCRHVQAMTAEGLDSKADIAVQLAWRDKRIAAQQELIEAGRRLREAAEGSGSPLDLCAACEAYDAAESRLKVTM